MPIPTTGVVVDIETLDTRSKSIVLSIGAVHFNRSTHSITQYFEQPLAIEPQQALNRTFSADTLSWWLQNPEAAKQALFNPQHPVDVLRDFCHWYPNATDLWGNGAGFDNVILETLYEDFGQTPPWRYNANRCYRTLKALYQHVVPAPTFEGVPHNALHDANHQAMHLMRILDHMEQS